MVSRLDGSIGSVRFACSRCGDIALPLVWLSYYSVFVCFLPINSGHQVRWTYQPGSHRRKVTGFLIHLLSAVRALIFLARRIQPFLSLVDREVEFCVLTIYSFSTRWSFLVCFYNSEKNPVCRDRTHVPTCQKVTRLPLSYRGDRHAVMLLIGISTYSIKD